MAIDKIDFMDEWTVRRFEAGTAAIQDRIAALKEWQELKEEESDEASA